MVPGSRSVRLMVSVAVLTVLAWPGAAVSNHHHLGGGRSGGSGDDINADCLVWAYVLPDGSAPDRSEADATPGDAATDDAGMSDAGADAAPPPDAGTQADAGPPAGAVLVCLEHATLFGCDCATGPAAGEGRPLGA